MLGDDAVRILIIAGYAPSLINFRGPLLKTLRNRGHFVTACAPGDDGEINQKLAEIGVRYERLHFERAGMNPVTDLFGTFQLYRFLRAERPDLVLNYTIKPVIYGSLAARAAGIRSVCSIITGLGYVFTKKSFMQRVVRALYRAALRRNDVVFFQNNDDRDEFRRLEILPCVSATVGGSSVGRPKVVVISGSGVDLEHFGATELQSDRAAEQECNQPAQQTGSSGVPKFRPSGPVFLLIARLLRDKGILEFAEAAKSLRAKYPDTRFQLVGAFDSNPAALTRTELDSIIATGALEYLGETADVRPYLAACDVYVLPSYREGTPRTVLEAMATGRAIVTTDAPGCRETVRRGPAHDGAPEAGMPEARAPEAGTATTAAPTSDELATNSPPTGVTRGDNGFLVPVRDVEGLRWAMEQFTLHPKLIDGMGSESRRYAEERYDVHKVNAVILRELGV